MNFATASSSARLLGVSSPELVVFQEINQAQETLFNFRPSKVRANGSRGKLSWMLGLLGIISGFYLTLVPFTLAVNVGFQEIQPSCGLIAMQMTDLVLVYETFTVHFSITAKKQKDLIGAIKLIVAKLNNQIKDNAQHLLKSRIEELDVTINRVETHLVEWEDYDLATKTKADLPVEFPLMPDSLLDEETMLKYLCKNYKAVCGQNTEAAVTAINPDTIHDDVAMLERILNELEDFNYGAISDRDVTKWAIGQLDAWRTRSGACDMSYTNYDKALTSILRSYDGLLGRTITLPCLSDDHEYTPYSIITAPVRVKGKLWKVSFDKEMMVLINKERGESRMIHPMDLQVLYHADKKLPYFDGIGMSFRKTPSYLAEIIPNITVSNPEPCPLSELSGIDYYSHVHFIAYDINKWLSINFRKEESKIHFSKGAQSHSIKVPTGVSIATIAKKVYLKPSLLTFVVKGEWRKLATSIFFEEAVFSDSDYKQGNNSVVLIKAPGPNWLNQWLIKNFGFSLEAILSASVVFAVLSTGLCIGLINVFRKCFKGQQKRKIIRKRTPRVVRHSSAVLKAVNPFLAGEELIPELW